MPSTGLDVLVLRSLADHGLVFCRLLGLLVFIPGINVSGFGWQLRALLLITLAAIITPNVSIHARSVLEGGIVQVVSTIDATKDVHEPHRQQVHSRTISVRPELGHQSLAAWIQLALAELCLGLILGVGVNLVLQGFRIGGTLIEHQTGMIIANNVADSDVTESGTGELFFWLGSVLFLISGGHLLLISTVLESFRDFPVGYGAVQDDYGAIIAGLVHQSLSLALQIAAPLIATQLLLSTALSYAGNTAPHFSSFGIANSVRIAAAIVVLSLTLSGLSESMLRAMPKIFVASIHVAEGR